MSVFNVFASNISASVDGDEFTDTLKSCKGDVEHFLSQCGEPDEPAPANPNPDATDEEQKAFKDAWTLKCFSNQATDQHVKKMAHRIKRGQRKDGHKINESQAEKLAQSVVDNAKNQDLSSLASAVLDSRK